ncbi:MAG: tetratricopeptide repeat protein [Actinomycetota bacterium]|nr:tetratricopeptide repeat protein [Actinomycetota bacterium]
MTQIAYSLFQRGSAFLDEGLSVDAIAPLEEARVLEPLKASICEALARAYFGAGRFRSAEEEFKVALGLEPTNHYAHFGIALCLERRGLRDEARGHAKLAVAMRPENERYQEALSRIAAAS